MKKPQHNQRSYLRNINKNDFLSNAFSAPTTYITYIHILLEMICIPYEFRAQIYVGRKEDSVLHTRKRAKYKHTTHTYTNTNIHKYNNVEF